MGSKRARVGSSFLPLLLFLLFAAYSIPHFSSPKCPICESAVTVTQTPVSVAKTAPPVPCMGVVIASDPKLFLLRLFYSWDHPVERLVIAYGGNETMLEAELDHISSSFTGLTTVYLGRWAGVAQGWNRIIEACATSPWYMIVNMDVQFEPGSLAEFSQSFSEDVAQGAADFGGPICLNIGDGKSGCGFTAFALSRRMRDTVGLFDENIYPAYYEDSDYWRRVVASKLPSKAYSTSRVWHSWHHQSQSSSAFLTKSTSPVTFKAIQSATQKYTIPYLSEKWGCDNSTQVFEFADCKFSTPWNQSDLTHWVKPPDTTQNEKVDFLIQESQKE